MIKKSIKDSAKQRFYQTFDNIKKKVQIGGRKRKNKSKYNKSKRFKSIFD